MGQLRVIFDDCFLFNRGFVHALPISSLATSLIVQKLTRLHANNYRQARNHFGIESFNSGPSELHSLYSNQGRCQRKRMSSSKFSIRDTSTLRNTMTYNKVGGQRALLSRGGLMKACRVQQTVSGFRLAIIFWKSFTNELQATITIRQPAV